MRPGPKNPAASTCAREGSNRERAGRLSYSVGGALHGAQKGLGSFFNRGRRHGEGSRWRHQGFEDNAGALSRFLSAQQPSHKLKCRARTKKSKTAEAAGQVLVSAPILSGPLESAKHHKQKRTHMMMMMTKTTRAALGHQQVLVLFHLGRSAEHGRGANFSLYLREPTGRFVIKAKFYGPRKSLSRA